MAEVTKIAWAHSTFNPWIGCTKIGPGCDNCYAAAGDQRFTGGSRWGAGAPRHHTSVSYWRQPINWDKKAAKSGQPWRVFCASQADVFDNEVDPDWRAHLWTLIKCTPHLTWLLLTKRVGNVQQMLPADWNDGYPNVWLGITVVTQEEAYRDVPKLERIPARVRWLSIEPQIERIDLCEMFGIWWNSTMHVWEATGSAFKRPVNWVVCGGESAQRGKCRAFELDWARSLRRTCDAVGIKFFMKQLGTVATDRGALYQHEGKGEDPAGWPVELRVREFPQ